jgi:hypothetical protein
VVCFNKTAHHLFLLPVPLSISRTFSASRAVTTSLIYLRDLSSPTMAYQNKLWNNYKSDGERRIGTYLQDRGINFTYERPVLVVDSGRQRIWYPDFSLDDYHILIEYLGMTGNERNDRLNEYKRRTYRENKYDVIEIYPSDFNRDWGGIIDKGIYGTLERRVKDYLSKYRRSSDSPKSGKIYGQASFKFYR